MKTIIYSIAITLLLVSCKQDIPFPDGVEDGYRINRVETYNIDTITGDTVYGRQLVGVYDNKNRIKKISFNRNNEFNSNLDFDYPNATQIIFHVSPLPYWYQTVTGRVIYNKDYIIESIQHKYKNEYDIIGGWLSRDFLKGNDYKLDSSYYYAITENGAIYPSLGYTQCSFNGNNIIYYSNNSSYSAYGSVPLPTNGIYNRKQVSLIYNIFPNVIYNNYQLINIDDNFLLEKVFDNSDFIHYIPNAGVDYSQEEKDVYNTVQYFLPSFNWTGCGQDALVATRTITGQTTYVNNVVEPYYQYNTYEYEADGMGRITKKIRKTGAGVVDRVWYFWYE